jgi:hypothetical protein
MPSRPRPIACIPFTDGAVPPVHEDADGRQYVEEEGERVYGVWVLPDEPNVREGARPGADAGSAD